MGVLKNDVGRPSNKTIRIRFVLKSILTIIIAGGLFIGGYLLNDMSKNKNINQENKQETNKQTEVIKDVYAKYKNVDFIRSTEAQYYHPTGKVDGVLNHDVIDLKVNKGEVSASTTNYETNETKQINVTGITSNVKYITCYGQFMYDIPFGSIAALTEDNKVYQGSYKEDKKAFEFILLQEDVIEMLGTDDIGTMSNAFYLLTTKGDLRLVSYDNYHKKDVLTDRLYENRHVYLGNFHDGGYSHQIVIDESDNTLSFINYDMFTSNNDNIYKGFSVEKYNDKIIKVKYAFISEKDFNMDKPNGWIESYLYIVTEDNEILTTKKPSTQIGNNPKETYEFKLYKASKVKVIEYAKLGEDSYNTVNITYEDGTIEQIKAYYVHKTM